MLDKQEDYTGALYRVTVLKNVGRDSCEVEYRDCLDDGAPRTHNRDTTRYHSSA